MISSQIIQKTLDELRTITRIDLCVMDIDGKVNSTTFPVENEDFGDVRAFADSMADSQVMRGYHFFKIYDNQTVEYVLIAKGSNEDAYMIGRVAAVVKAGAKAHHQQLLRSNCVLVSGIIQGSIPRIVILLSHPVLLFPSILRVI